MGYDIYPHNGYSIEIFYEQPHLNTLLLWTQVKLFVTVHSKDAHEVRMELGSEKAGLIGDYTHCSFSTKIDSDYECIETVIKADIYEAVVSKIKAVYSSKVVEISTSPLFQISSPLLAQLAETKKDRYY